MRKLIMQGEEQSGNERTIELNVNRKGNPYVQIKRGDGVTATMVLEEHHMRDIVAWMNEYRISNVKT